MQTLLLSWEWAGPVKAVYPVPGRHYDQRVHQDLQAFVCGGEVRQIRVRQEEEDVHIPIAARQSNERPVHGVIGCLSDAHHIVTYVLHVLHAARGWN